jgi:hypothetical protein
MTINLAVDASVPSEVSDPINARILAVSEDRIAGFVEEPFAEIAWVSDLPEEVVMERLRAMLAARVIRRIRQTLMATNLAPGALVAWRVPAAKIDAAFRYMVDQDPFSGHVVVRSTDGETAGSVYRLWTTLKVPQGFSMQRHLRFLAEASRRGMLFASCRRRSLHARRWSRSSSWNGARPLAARPGRALDTNIVDLAPFDWQAYRAQARIQRRRNHARPLDGKSGGSGVSREEFLRVARSLSEREVIGKVFNFPGARQTIRVRRARHAIQRTLPLAGSHRS